MVAGTLSAQLGAMSIIDELRRKQMMVAEQLDLPRRRADVEQRIRAYYDAQNIPVDDGLIAKGVRAYFDGRLQFRPASPGKLQALLSRLYVQRARHASIYRRCLRGAAVGLALWGGMAWFDHWSLHSDSREHVAQLSEVLETGRASQKSVAAQVLALAPAGRADAAQPLLPAAAMLAKAQADLKQAEPILKEAVPDPDGISKENRDAFLAAIDRRKAQVESAQVLLSQSAERLQRLEQLMTEQAAMLSLQRLYEGDALWNAAPILELRRQAQQLLDRDDGAGADGAPAAVKQLRSKLQSGSQAAIHGREVQAAVAQFGKMGLSGSDRKRIEALAQSAAVAVAGLDGDRAGKLAEQAELLLNFARLPLTIVVADREGVRSGVERNYNESGGKSWYLIVEALDADEENVRVPVRSAETGDDTWAQFYGVRVSSAEYQKVKAEKQASGHVESRAMGSKAANSLTVRYVRTLKAQPDMITEW